MAMEKKAAPKSRAPDTTGPISIAPPVEKSTRRKKKPVASEAGGNPPTADFVETTVKAPSVQVEGKKAKKNAATMQVPQMPPVSSATALPLTPSPAPLPKQQQIRQPSKSKQKSSEKQPFKANVKVEEPIPKVTILAPPRQGVPSSSTSAALQAAASSLTEKSGHTQHDNFAKCAGSETENISLVANKRNLPSAFDEIVGQFAKQMAKKPADIQAPLNGANPAAPRIAKAASPASNQAASPALFANNVPLPSTIAPIAAKERNGYREGRGHMAEGLATRGRAASRQASYAKNLSHASVPDNDLAKLTIQANEQLESNVQAFRGGRGRGGPPSARARGGARGAFRGARGARGVSHEVLHGQSVLPIPPPTP